MMKISSLRTLKKHLRILAEFVKLVKRTDKYNSSLCLRRSYLQLHSLTLTFQKICFYLLQWKPFENDEKCFLVHVTALFVLEVYPSMSWLFGCLEKRFDKVAMVNFKIYDVTIWTSNNYNTHIAQYLQN